MFIFKRVAAIVNVRLFPRIQETLIETGRLEKKPLKSLFPQLKTTPLRAKRPRSVNIQNI